jgi:cyanophycinase
MTQDTTVTEPGAVALVGSGEYTPAMRETDAYLLNTLGGAANTVVALLPTASGREPGSPERWNAMGAEHFAGLGVGKTGSVQLVDRAGADAPDAMTQAILERANFYYFSGGDPNYLIQCLRNTPAWTTIAQRHARGAVLAGCSAGAMALGGLTVSLRGVQTAETIEWLPGLGVVPQLICFPHFDRMSRIIGEERFQALIEATPAGFAGLGLDEDTALVRVSLPSDVDPRATWRVMGRQTVSVFVRGEPPRVLRAGDDVTL